MNALLLVALLNGSTLNIQAIAPSPQNQPILIASYTPLKLGTLGRRRRAGTR